MEIYELELPGTPPSINTIGVGSSAAWAKARKVKDNWQGAMFIALLEAKVPKPLVHVEATAVLRFKSNRRRDEGNYRAVLEKALGDALQTQWLEDDTPEFFRFGSLSFSEEAGTPTTFIRLEVDDGSA